MNAKDHDCVLVGRIQNSDLPLLDLQIELPKKIL